VEQNMNYSDGVKRFLHGNMMNHTRIHQ